MTATSPKPSPAVQLHEAVRLLADFRRRAEQCYKVCYEALNRANTPDPDVDDAITILRGDLDRIGREAMGAGLLDETGEPVVDR